MTEWPTREYGRLELQPYAAITFFSARCASFHIDSLFSPSSVSMSYFILAVLMRKCLGKQSCMSSTLQIVRLNGTWSQLSEDGDMIWKQLGCC